MTADRPWPIELRLDAAKTTLWITFDSGEIFELPAEYLRIESPSAEVQGHAPSQKQIMAGKRHVQITNLEPVGNYAVRILFDDGHDTGLYSWDYLQDLGRNRGAKWSAYLRALKAKGLDR